MDAERALADYLETHKAPPPPRVCLGEVRARPPAPEFLLRADRCWFVRFPNGQMKWVSEPWLTQRGFTIPAAPCVAGLTEPR